MPTQSSILPCSEVHNKVFVQDPFYNKCNISRDSLAWACFYESNFLQVAFEDVIAEPDGAHSNDCVWKCSFRCFTGAKLCCYRLLTCKYSILEPNSAVSGCFHVSTVAYTGAKRCFKLFNVPFRQPL